MLSTLLLRRGGISSRRVAGGEARRWFSNGGFGESSEYNIFLHWISFAIQLLISTHTLYDVYIKCSYFSS